LLAVALAVALCAAGAASAATVWTWGLDNEGELGHIPYPGTTKCGTIPCAPAPVGSLAGATAIAGGFDHSLAVRAGRLVSWGDNRFGELGIGTTTGPVTCSAGFPCSVKPLLTKFHPVVAVAAGVNFSLALLSNGTVEAWGNNAVGQLGDGTTTSSSTPVLVSGLSNVKAIAAGGSHALALLNNGTLMAWGENDAGELGDGTFTGPQTCPTGAPCSTTPVFVGSIGNGPIHNVRAIAAGDRFSVALVGSSFEQVEAWGQNSAGQLGQGTTSGPDSCYLGEPCSPAPMVISSLGGITIGIAANADAEQALALISGGTVAAWGYNNFGQAGSACGNPCPTPKLVPGVQNATAIATSSGSGQARSLALTSDGHVLEWGSSPLGNGTFPGGSATPVTVSGLAGPTAIATGGQHSLAIAAPPRNRFSVPNIQCVCTVATLHVHIPGPGLLVAGPNIHHGTLALAARKKSLLKKTTVTVAKAGTVKLKIRLTAAGRRALKRRHKLKLKVLLTFTPSGGSPASNTVTVTFKR
jgi:alpha-tubulin suppressor-like RCC1 family protein